MPSDVTEALDEAEGLSYEDVEEEEEEGSAR